MKKTLILFLGFLTINSYAQNENDALRYSTQNIFGTAKFNSMGGSFGSLGGDFTTLSFNPAGIAFYQNSELSFTPNFSMKENNTSLNENNFTNNKFSSSISNFGFVAVGKNQHEDWKRINIGFGWNQLSSFESKLYTQTQNNTSSLADLLLNQANGNIIDELNSFGASPAFWSDLIDLENNFVDTTTNWYAFDNGNYISHVNPNAEKTQSNRVNTNGNMGEYVISLGSSYQEDIYFGVTIGIPSVQYSERNTYSEENFADTTYGLNSFIYEENIVAYGSGVNLKLGAIMRVGEKTKVGVAFHSPSYISMEEEFSTSVTTNWDFREKMSEDSPFGYFNYELTTPWKMIASASTIINNKFLLNAEIEQTDYSSTRLYSDVYSFTDENSVINDLYTKATNIRVGGEANFHPFKLRGGYALYASPFKDNPEFETENYSGGIGIDFGGTFFDMSYTISKNSGTYSMYSPETEPHTSVNSEKHYLLFTLGFRY